MSLLPMLANHVDLVAYGGEQQPPGFGGMPREVRWKAQSAWPSDARDAQFDAAIYHVGNNHVHHEWIVDGITEVPSVVVLHDLSLLDFWYGLGSGGKGDSQFISRFEYSYGRTKAADITEVGLGEHLRYDWLRDANRLQWPMVRPIVDRADVVVVHSNWARDMIERTRPGTAVVVAPFGADLQFDVMPGEARESFGVPDDGLLVGVLGGLSRPKQVTAVLRAVGNAVKHGANVRLLIAGRADDTRYLAEIRERVNAYGISDRCTIELDCEAPRLLAAHVAVDCIVNLRRPTVGETSASLLYSFGAGKLAFVSAHPQMTEYPAEFCVSIPTDPEAEAAALTVELEELANDRARCLRAGLAARAWVDLHSTWAHAGDAYALAVRMAVTNSSGRIGSVPAQQRLGAVDILGDLTAGSGLAEAGRRLVSAVEGAGYTTWVRNISITTMPRLPGAKVRQRVLAPGDPYSEDLSPVAISTLNINEFGLLPRSVEKLCRENSYLIAYWFWEGTRLPESYRKQVHRVDEIWVAAEFVRRAFEAEDGPPVRVVPTPIEFDVPTDVTRASLGLPDNRFIFLFSFDANSSEFRKNPFGVIRAYDQAFPERTRHRPMLVIKVNRLDHNPQLARDLRAAAKAAGVRIIDADLTNAQMVGLLNAADSYVSLHRCEGFGLGMAEAMYLGKPVIGTGFSANVDFMSPTNSFLVGYTPRLVQAEDFRYNPLAASVYADGLWWVEPDLQQASRWMQYIVENPRAASAIGEQAALDMRQNYSVEAVGKIVRARLDELVVPAVSVRSVG